VYLIEEQGAKDSIGPLCSDVDGAHEVRRSTRTKINRFIENPYRS